MVTDKELRDAMCSREGAERLCDAEKIAEMAERLLGLQQAVRRTLDLVDAAEFPGNRDNPRHVDASRALYDLRVRVDPAAKPCPDCGHIHAANMGGICIGCPCKARPAANGGG